MSHFRFRILVAAGVAIAGAEPAFAQVQRNDIIRPMLFAAAVGGYDITAVGQRDQARYSSSTLYNLLWTDSCKAAVFTMIAVAAGKAKNDTALQSARIDQLENLSNSTNMAKNNGAAWPPHNYPNGYQKASLALYGNVIKSATNPVSFGTAVALGTGTIDLSKIANSLAANRPVMLRGRVCKASTSCSGDARANSASVTEDHWVLAVDTVKSGNVVTGIKVLDPWTAYVPASGTRCPYQTIGTNGKFQANATANCGAFGSFGVVEMTPVTIVP